jgi:hypothetical protein
VSTDALVAAAGSCAWQTFQEKLKKNEALKASVLSRAGTDRLPSYVCAGTLRRRGPRRAIRPPKHTVGCRLLCASRGRLHNPFTPAQKLLAEKLARLEEEEEKARAAEAQEAFLSWKKAKDEERAAREKERGGAAGPTVCADVWQRGRALRACVDVWPWWLLFFARTRSHAPGLACAMDGAPCSLAGAGCSRTLTPCCDGARSTRKPRRRASRSGRRKRIGPAGSKRCVRSRS